MSFISVLMTSIVAVLCGLDRTAVLQLMLSRPIVAGPLRAAAATGRKRSGT